MEPLLLLFSTTLGVLTLMATVAISLAKRLNMLCPANHSLSQGCPQSVLEDEVRDNPPPCVHYHQELHSWEGGVLPECPGGLFNLYHEPCSLCLPSGAGSGGGAIPATLTNLEGGALPVINHHLFSYVLDLVETTTFQATQPLEMI